MQRGNLRI